MSQINLVTLPLYGLHGKITKVSSSGCRYISDSPMLAKLSIDEPSKHIDCSILFPADLL